jgi:hypothetical protein
MRTTCAIALLIIAGVASAGCNRSKESAPPVPNATATGPSSSARVVTVVGVILGRGVGADKKVVSPSDTFGPNDTIYAAVDTQGATAAASLSARWTYQDGQTVSEETQPIAPTGPATTEFHVSKPDGWPAGSYKVEILLDGVSVRTASFRVT